MVYFLALSGQWTSFWYFSSSCWCWSRLCWRGWSAGGTTTVTIPQTRSGTERKNLMPLWAKTLQIWLVLDWIFQNWKTFQKMKELKDNLVRCAAGCVSFFLSSLHSLVAWKNFPSHEMSSQAVAQKIKKKTVCTVCKLPLSVSVHGGLGGVLSFHGAVELYHSHFYVCYRWWVYSCI